MYRYSERPIRFGVPFNPDECSAFIITFKQGDIVLEKNKEDLADSIADITENNGRYWMAVRLTQEECGAFVAEKPIKVQMTFVLNGYRDETNVQSFSLEEVMKDGVVDG